MIDDFDIGFYHFYGNSRNPKLSINQSSLKLDQYYPKSCDELLNP